MKRQVNLIPQPRREAQQTRQRVRRWATICSAYAVLLVMLYGGLQMSWGHSSTAIENDMGAVSGEIESAQQEVATVKPKLAAAQLTLSASQAVGSQADFSILLALLAESLGDDVVLSSCKLEPTRTVATTGDGKPPATPQGFTLHVTGMARSQEAVAQYVLRLEQSGLFQKVKNNGFTRTPFEGGEAVAFRLACTLGG